MAKLNNFAAEHIHDTACDHSQNSPYNQQTQCWSPSIAQQHSGYNHNHGMNTWSDKKQHQSFAHAYHL